MPKDTPEKRSFLRHNLLRAAYLLRSLESHWNLPLLPREGERSFLREWEGPSLDLLSAARPRVLVTITTFRRPSEVSALIRALAVTADAGTWVLVLNDRSDADLTTAKALLAECFPGRSLWLDARAPMGKRRFWRTHQVTFFAARRAGAEFLLSLQDDIDLVPDFFPRLWAAWGATGQDLGRRMLYLFSNTDDAEEGRWVSYRRTTLPGVPARRTDWLDLQGYLIDRRGLELLRYWVVPVTAWRWRRNPNSSSGVGRQFTRRLFGRASTWQCDPPLIFHGGAPSEMNAVARGRNPLDNRSLFPGPPPAP